MNSKIILLLISVFLITSISAADWDNVKSYDSTTDTVTIKNAFGFGGDIGQATLKTPEIVYVPTGYQKVAEFEINSLTDYTDFIKEIKLYDMNDGKKEFTRKLDLKYKTYESYSVNDYVSACSLLINGTNSCYPKLVGSHIEQRTIWKDFDGSPIKSGDKITIGIFTDVQFGDKIEWIPNIFGVEVNEWALWENLIKSSYDQAAADNIAANFNTTTNLYTYNGSYYISGTGAGSDYNMFQKNSLGISGFNATFWMGSIRGSGQDVVFALGQGQATVALSSICVDGNTFTTINNGYVMGIARNRSSAGIFKVVNGIATKIYPTTGCIAFADFGNATFQAMNLTYDGSTVGWNIAGTTGTVSDNSYTSGSSTGFSFEIFSGAANAGQMGIKQMYIGTIDNSAPSVTLPEYTNGTIKTNTDTLTLNISVIDTGGSGLTGSVCSININGTNQSIAVSSGWCNTTSAWLSGLGNGNRTIWVYANDTANNMGLNNSYVVNINNPPSVTISLLTPTSAANSTTSTNYFVANHTVSSGNLTNTTLVTWYSNGTLFGKNLTALTGSNYNVSNLSFTNFTIGSYIWNQLTYYTNLTGGNVSRSYAATNFTFNVGSNVTNTHYNSTVSETASENISIDIKAYNSTTPTSALLKWNGTSYSASIVDNSGGNFTIYRTIDIPTISTDTNITYNFTWNTGGIYENSSNTNQTIQPINLSYCQTAPSFINFTFKDESSLAVINASISTSSFNYYLGSGTTSKTLSYSNTTQSPSYAFCFLPATKTIATDYTISYGATGYPTRIYDPTTINLSSITTNQTLYLLSSTDGQYVTFQVVDSSASAVSGVFVNASTVIDGTTTVVGQGTTDAAGSITFWLNPSASHTFYFVKSGYTTYVTSITPSQTIYTIQLSSTTATNVTDTTEGVLYSIKPTAGTTLTNNTVYNFNFTVNSTTLSLTNFGFSLVGENGTLIAQNSSTTSTGGIVYVNANTLNYTSIIMEFYWTYNGTQTNGTVFWFVMDTTSGTGWSILNFFNDLRTYTTSGIFGLDSDSLALIIFVFIFTFTGIVSYKFSITSPAAISGIVFSLVALFDIGLGMIPNPVGAVDNFPTIFFGILMVGFIINEVTT